MLLWMALLLAGESHFAWLSIGEGGGKKQPPFYSDMSCSHIFCEKGSFFFIIREGQKSYLENPLQKMYSAVKFIKSDQPALKFLTG
jgi:hypothetical protein